MPGPATISKVSPEAASENKYITIEFNDSEYIGFFKAMIADNANKLLND